MELFRLLMTCQVLLLGLLALQVFILLVLIEVASEAAGIRKLLEGDVRRQVERISDEYLRQVLKQVHGKEEVRQ